jgi:hypothetical protein
MRILKEVDRVIRCRTLKFIKVLWTNQMKREATWELITKIQDEYRKLFTSGE